METQEIARKIAGITTEEMMDDFYSYLKKKADTKDNSDYYSSGIHCSQLDSCIRKVVLGYFNFPKKDKTLAELLMFEIANFVHELMSQWAKATDKFELIGEEHVLTEGLPEGVSGKCDLLLKHKKSGKTILTDTKTAMPSAFKEYSTWLVKFAHELQINTYRMGLEKLGYAIEEMILTYFDRGGTNSPVFVRLNKIDDKTIEATIDVYRKAVADYKKDKVLPAKTPLIFEISKTGILRAKKSWECDYCDYCGVSCEGYPDFDRKTFKRVGRITGDRLLAVDPKYQHLSAEITRQYNQQQSEGLGIL